MVRSLKRARALFAALSLSLGLTVLPGAAGATGQCEPMVPAEQYLHNPDYFSPFAAGKLGLVRREFTNEFLVPAYLVLSGGRFDAATQKQLVRYWRDVHHVRTIESTPKLPSPEGLWKEARRRVPGAPLPQSYAKLDYGWQGSCLKDAFRGATKTLARIQSQPGVAEADVAAWALAQDQVFGHCLFGAKAPNIPAPLPPTALPVLRAERDYQIAAAQFYAGDYPSAAAGFARIAQDPASPWAPWGGYLEARAHLRRSLATDRSDGLRAAQPLLERAMKQGELPEIRENARALLGFVRIRLEPGLRLRQLAAELQKDHEGYLRALRDYLFGLDRMPDPRARGSDRIDPDSVASRFLPDDREKMQRDSDLSDWILTFNRPRALADLTPPRALEHSLERYQKLGSPPWLLAAIALVPPGHPSARSLIEAANRLPRSSPAYDTATYHVLRLLQAPSDLADRAAFAKRLDAELAARSQDPPSSLRNQLLDWRLELAKTLDEALAYAERFGLGDEGCGFPHEAIGDPPPLHRATRQMTPGLIRAIEHEAPLARIAALSAHPKLPAALRPPLARLAYSRALLLGESDPAARALAERLEPQVRARLRASAAQHLLAARAAPTPEERRFHLALLLLDSDTLNPVSLGVNDGWCGSPMDSREGPGDPPARSYFSAADIRQVGIEHERLQELGSGSFVVAVRWMLEYGRLHPEDPRLPELLHNINQLSKRTHCESTEWSKKAFLFMHQTYPQHPLTKKVKYWY